MSIVEVFNAPKRRIDNEVSRLSDALLLLQMHCKVVEDLQQRYRSAMWRYKIFQGGATVLTLGVPAGLVFMQMPIEIAAIAGGVGAVVTAGITFLESRSLSRLAYELVEQSSLEGAFRRQYARKIAEKDEDTMTRWIRVLEILKIGLTGPELQKMSKISASDVRNIETKLNQDVPDLRRAAGPALRRNVRE